jgi:outer membrane protein OmpA-like peptidoglycan-associated protein
VARAKRQSSGAPFSGEGTFWGPVVYLLGALAAVLALIAAVPHEPPAASALPDSADTGETIRELLAEHGEFASQWRRAMNDFCSDPMLQAEGVAPDCASGTVTFGDELFDKASHEQLTEEGIRKLQLAIDAMLRSLRAQPLAWQGLESIELRGHADPRARRDPYVTNMQVSQKRPMSLMFYLISDWALSERDRADLERLLVLSAASFSRPPKSCPERTRECYPHWRRVEITPRMRDAQLMSRLGLLVDGVEALLPAAPGRAGPRS